MDEDQFALISLEASPEPVDSNDMTFRPINPNSGDLPLGRSPYGYQHPYTVDSTDMTSRPLNPDHSDHLPLGPSPYINQRPYTAYRRTVRLMRSERRQVLYMKNLISFLIMSFLFFCLLVGIVLLFFTTKDLQGNKILSGGTVMIVVFFLGIPMGGFAINAWQQFVKIRGERRRGLGYREDC
ncbi:hypothetical protein RUND412_005120 [Rhizina undulata]